MAKFSFKNMQNGLRTIDALYNQFVTAVPNPDEKFRDDGITIYDGTMQDHVVKGCMNTINEAVNAMDYELNPGNTTKEQELQLIDSVIYNFLNKDFKRACLDAMLFGNNYLDIIWGLEGNYIIPVDFVVKAHEAFYYNRNKETRQFELWYYGENTSDKNMTPPYKVLVPTYDSDYLNPYGRGLLSTCYKTVFIKNNITKFWAIFTEDHGIPDIDVGVSLDYLRLLEKDFKTELEDAIEDIQDIMEDRRQGGVITHIKGDNGIEIKSLDSGNSEHVTIHKTLIEHCDDQNRILLLGHTGTSRSTSGRLGEERSALTVLDDRVEAYGKFVANNLNQLIDWVHFINFGNNDSPWVNIFDPKTKEKSVLDTYKTQAEIDAILVEKMGVSFVDEYIAKTYGKNIKDFTISIKPTTNSLQNMVNNANELKAIISEMEKAGQDTSQLKELLNNHSRIIRDKINEV